MPNDLINYLVRMWIKGASDSSLWLHPRTIMCLDFRFFIPAATEYGCSRLFQSVYIRQQLVICFSASKILFEIRSPNPSKSELWNVCAAPVALPALPETSGASLFIGKFSYRKRIVLSRVPIRCCYGYTPSFSANVYFPIAIVHAMCEMGVMD